MSKEENEEDIFSLSFASISSRGSVGSSGLGEWLPIDQRIEELQMKYRSTLETLSDHFKHRVTAQMIHKTLPLMSPELKTLKTYQQVANTNSEEVFASLVDATNYRHTEILQKLVSDLGDSKCKAAMSLYQEDLKTFNAETILKELPNSWPGGSDSSREENIILHMGDKWEVKTLQDFTELKKRIQRKARFGIHDLQIQEVGHASLRVVLTAVSITANISDLKLIEPDFLKLNNVLRVSVGDNIIYDIKSPKVCTYIVTQNPPNKH